MAFDWGPESAVLMPGPSDRAESSDVAKVSVTKGKTWLALALLLVERVDRGGK